MKKTLNIFGLLFAAGLSYAQTTGPSTDQNYIYTKNCLNEDCSKKAEAVEYSDGLGRSKQIISIKGSPNGKDIVTPVEYDEFGRQVKSYLPIPQSGTQNGAIYTNPKSNAPQTYGSDPYIYSKSVLENSPSAKILSQTRPGTDYQGHSASFTYAVNAAGDVKKYTVNVADDKVTLSGTYNAGELIKTSVTNEDGHTTTEFKNGKGQTILVRKENADTYYVYNKFGQLASVIPPLASALPSISTTVLDDLCYQYKYDTKGRQVEKKLPGKGWEYMVYDKTDQLVMSQDANLKAQGKWMLTKYDRYGRVVLTGITNNAATRSSLQTSLNEAAYTFEIRSIGSFTVSGMPIYYTNRTLPGSIAQVLTVNYYDTYPSGSPVRPAQILNKNTIGDNMADAVNTKNLPTASYVKNIEDDNWTKNYIWYDTKGRAIGTHSINHLGGYTKTESSLDFAGVILQTKTYHKRLSSDTEKVITQTFEYDSGNRLKKQWHQVDSNPQELLSENTYNDLSQLTQKKVGNNLQTIDYTYNLRGAVTKVNDPANLGTDLFGYSLSYYDPSGSGPGKYNGSISEVSWKSSQDNILRKYAYQYDALNRLTKGTYSEPNASVPQNNFFNETVSYDLGGNISTLERNSKGFSGTAELIDNLTYNYEGNRLTYVKDESGNYSGYPDVSGNPISYDGNGNMKDHKDKGILQIEYNILDLTNKITFDKTYLVRDLLTGGFNTFNVATNYTYDSKGSKLRKKYTYGGIQLGSEISVTTDYLDGFQYETENTSPTILKFVPTSEGYFNFENNKYIYSYTDHLGNVRLSYFNNGSGTEVLEENNFYPFGLKHEGYNAIAGNPAYNYQYNGKEYQKETGWSDFGARMYMPDIGRWGVIDPLAETTTRLNPYNYALNNPVMFIDPDGRKAYSPEPIEVFQSSAGAWGYFAGGGSATFGSFAEFLGQDNLFYQSASGGGGGNASDDGAKTVGETQWYKNLMASFYFGNIDFSQFGTDGDEEKKALKYKEQYELNRNIQMAETILSEALLETTQNGKILRYGLALQYSRKQLVKVYGSDDVKSINKVYSILVNKLDFVKKSLAGTDTMAYSTVVSGIIVALGANTLKLEIKNEYLLHQIKKLDIGVYRSIFPTYETSQFGGGGAKGKW